jgi:hypothetical protein
LEEAAKW